MTIELQKVIHSPVVTEKTTAMKEAANQVVFRVDKNATKPAIKEAVEKAFKVKVEAVRTMVVRGKEKKYGRFTGRRPGWKKAVVSLKEGQNIEFFEGV